MGYNRRKNVFYFFLGMLACLGLDFIGFMLTIISSIGYSSSGKEAPLTAYIPVAIALIINLVSFIIAFGYKKKYLALGVLSAPFALFLLLGACNLIFYHAS